MPMVTSTSQANSILNDPACGMTVDESIAAAVREHGEQHS
jgi:hypothetical protein